MGAVEQHIHITHIIAHHLTSNKRKAIIWEHYYQQRNLQKMKLIYWHGMRYTYADIERLSSKAGMNVIDFIEHLRFGESEKIGKYNIYTINGYEVAVQYFKKKKK